jgi:dihydrodipicolinate reductase
MAVDVNGLKGRIGEALVEGILREARFKVSRLGRESQVQQLLKTGSSEFLPDFLIWTPVGE